MSPTVFRWKGYRLFFFSREERRAHVHVYCAEGEAKIWLEPAIELAQNWGLSKRSLAEVLKVVRDRSDEIRDAWNQHLGG
jgi:hypothetical protein